MSAHYVFVAFFVMIFLIMTTRAVNEATLTNYEFERGESNNYHFSFNTSDGTSRTEDGKDDENQNLAVDGSVSWVAQDGSTYVMTFKADNRGFRPIIKRVSGP